MRAMGVPCVDDPEELTAEWITAALQSTGNDAVVRAVRKERIGTGQIGASYRLHLDLAQPADGSVPRTLVAKVGAGAPEARDLVKMGFEKEVRFYQHLAPLTAVSTPRCWYADISEDLLTFTLLMQDLAPRIPGRQVDGCTPEQAATAVANLASLHGPLWCAPVLAEHAAWLAPMDAASGGFLQSVLGAATTQFIERYRDRLSEQDQSTVIESTAAIGRWTAVESDVFSVVHGDYRLDNLMFDPTDGSVSAVDWQTATTGPPARDLAYFLSTSLHTADRRIHESRLIQDYVDGLARHGVVYPVERATQDYRVGMLQGPLITVLGAIYATATPSADADDMFMAMATRSCAAIRDLATLDHLSG